MWVCTIIMTLPRGHLAAERLDLLVQVRVGHAREHHLAFSIDFFSHSTTLALSVTDFSMPRSNPSGTCPVKLGSR